MRNSISTLLALLATLWLLPESYAQMASNVVVAFTTTNSTPLNQGYAGFTTELLGKGIEYDDTNMQHFAATLSPGWLLFPAGETGDAFDWSTGMTVSNWVQTVGLEQGPMEDTSNLCAGTIVPLIGKGGVWFTNFATLAANLGGARIICCVNGFTDTNVASAAGAFAAYAITNHIQVAAWELCNEPYLFSGTNEFFTNGTDYLNKMKPYRDAIKAVDSNAVVAVFYSDPSRSSMAWDNNLKNYTNQYWDAAVYHYYPDLGTNAPFADLMAEDNAVLYSNSTLYVSNVLMADNHSNNVTFMLTELNPNLGNGNSLQNQPTGTLYGGVFASEYLMRLSTIPQVTFAGSYQLVNGSGVNYTNDERSAVAAAASGGYVTNTVGLPFGYFLSAQGTAEAVAYWALNRSTAVYPTTVGTNGPVVPMDTNDNTTMPAVYAQAYQGGNGLRYVLLTNKGYTNVPVLITGDNNVVLTNQFLETYVTGTDPSVVNSNPPSNNVVIRSMTVTNPVVIPEYSVVRLEWAVFNVPSPVLGVTFTDSTPSLHWAGLTDVVYDVQGSPDLMGTWPTLGKVSSTQTNFSFTDPVADPMRFYRLTVP